MALFKKSELATGFSFIGRLVRETEPYMTWILKEEPLKNRCGNNMKTVFFNFLP